MRFSTILKAAVLTLAVSAIVCEEAANKGSPVEFQSDVAKMLDILINSLYTNRAIFLREIISNASDALDKIRFLYIKDPKDPKNKDGEAPTMDIRISVDREKNLFVLRDGGIGMTKDDMGKTLGSLGSSGTKKFVEGIKGNAEDDANLIGQFGVGFYSVFLVADRVRVASKHDDSDTQWIWESTGDGNYYIYEDERGNTLGRGTELMLELKKDASEYLESDKIKEIIHRYSEFIHFPIYIQTTKIERVPKKKDGEDEAEKPSEDGEVSDSEEKKEEEFEDVTTTAWDLVNENKPIWTRKLEDVTEEDYNKFYKSLTKDYDDPMYYTHFSAEGEVDFKALLFVPGRAPYNVFDTSVAQNNIRLYVRRVFITDEFRDLLPRYLNFIKGVVDSDDLPLNVSREVLQESRILKIIKKKLVRKALAMLADIAENDKKLDSDEKEEEDAEEEKSATGQKKQTEVLFPKFWEEFGKNLRLGMIEDGTNRARLTKLLRYKSSKSEEKLTSLQDYVDRSPESQKAIYFIASESIEKIKQSPVLEDAIARGIEVLYMVDAIDEYVVGHVTDFAGKKLVNLAKEGIQLDEGKEKKIQKLRQKKYEPLTAWAKELLGEKVTKVQITPRRTSEPLLLTSPQHGMSANMARIMKGQTLGEKSMDQGEAKRVLEINHLNPLVNEVYNRVQLDKEDETAKNILLALYDVAALQGGFEVEDTAAFSKRVGKLLRASVDIAQDATNVEEDMSEYEAQLAAEEAEEEEPKKEEAEADADEKEL